MTDGTFGATTGALLNSYVYNGFGKAAAGSSGPKPNPYKYTAREYDTETGLYYYRARYYDETIGRFISEDPLGFLGDGPNFYLYARNQPTNLADPLGLSSLVYDGSAGTLTVLDGNGNVVGTYPAANNAQAGSRGPWPSGTYDYAYHTTHPDDGLATARMETSSSTFPVVKVAVSTRVAPMSATSAGGAARSTQQMAA